MSYHRLVVKSNFFVHFLGELKIPKRHLEIKWPLFILPFFLSAQLQTIFVNVKEGHTDLYLSCLFFSQPNFKQFSLMWERAIKTNKAAMFILRYSCTICLKFVSASMISSMRRRQGIVIESTRGQQAEQWFENFSEGAFSLYF